MRSVCVLGLRESCQLHINTSNVCFQQGTSAIVRGLLEKYPTFGREKETGLLGALDT